MCFMQVQPKQDKKIHFSKTKLRRAEDNKILDCRMEGNMHKALAAPKRCNTCTWNNAVAT